MIKAGIIGGAGYVGGETIRLLSSHPEVHLEFVQSKSHSGLPLSTAHPDMGGETELSFVGEPATDVDVLFLCSGHGQSIVFLDNYSIPEATRIVDLSADFRFPRENHSFVYGLSELNRSSIQNAHYLSNPGCFATAIALSLLPLAQAKVLKSPIHCTAITGSTGAGQNPMATTHFSWRNNNVSVYKAFNHQHLDEIVQSLKTLQPEFDTELNFIPMRGNFTRGIFSHAYTECEMNQEELDDLYRKFYSSSPFIHISQKPVTLKEVVNTNKAHLYIEKKGTKVRIESIIDNLLKGAAGQAVQNMNLMFGLDEDCGLRLKASVF